MKMWLSFVDPEHFPTNTVHLLVLVPSITAKLNDISIFLGSVQLHHYPSRGLKGHTYLELATLRSLTTPSSSHQQDFV